jgi:flavin reductase
MSRFVTGVTVVSYATDDGPAGMTVNSFTSVSADPPLVLVSIARLSRRHGALTSRPFCVNVLGSEQLKLALAFTRPNVVAEPRWAAEAVVPRLANPLAWLECMPWRCYDGGDHTLVLGQVTDFGHREGDALTYAWSRFGHAAEAAEGIEYLF